jgi:hypothetical protein
MINFQPFVSKLASASPLSVKIFEEMMLEFIENHRHIYTIDTVTRIVEWVVKDSAIYECYPHDFVFAALQSFTKFYLKNLDIKISPVYVTYKKK